MALAYDLGEKIDIYDGGSDPAGLNDLRVLLHDELGRRWTRVAANVRRAIMQGDSLGVSDKSPRLYQPAEDKAALFGRWFSEQLHSGIGDGKWLAPYVVEAALRAQAHQESRNGLVDDAPGALVDVGPEDEPRDPRGRWTAHVVLEHDSNGRIGVLGVHSDLQAAQRQASERQADNADEGSDTGNLGAEVSVHGIDAPSGDRLTILASANADGDVAVHGVYASKAEAASARDAILRERWQREGRALDWDHPSTYATWDREVASWNSEHPDKAIGETYKFGTHPEFEQRLNKHIEGKVEPYPGASKANAYFADDSTHVQARTVTVTGHAVGDVQALGALVSTTTYEEGASAAHAQPKSASICYAASRAALAGIRDDVSREASQSVAAGLVSFRGRAARIAALVDRAMGRGLARSRMLGEHSISQAYSQATLDALEARGVRYVGSISEHQLRDAYLDDAARKTPQAQHHKTGRFAKAHVAARELFRRGSGRFGEHRLENLPLRHRARAQVLSPRLKRQGEERERELAAISPELSALTKQDDLVCPRCEELSANGQSGFIFPASGRNSRLATGNTARLVLPSHEVTAMSATSNIARATSLFLAIRISPGISQCAARRYTRPCIRNGRRLPTAIGLNQSGCGMTARKLLLVRGNRFMRPVS
jgi:hypothetical protein